MKIERIIQILNNREYTKVEESRFAFSQLFDITTCNGGEIRLERASTLLSKKFIFKLYLYVPGTKTVIKWWSLDSKSSYYHELDNIFEELLNSKYTKYEKYF